VRRRQLEKYKGKYW